MKVYCEDCKRPTFTALIAGLCWRCRLYRSKP